MRLRAVGAVLLVVAATALAGCAATRPTDLVANAAADLAGWQGVTLDGVVVDRDGVETRVTLAVTGDNAAHGELSRDFGAQAEFAAGPDGTMIKGNRQWWLWSRPGYADELADTWFANPTEESTGLVPVELLTPAGIARLLSAPGGSWARTGERRIGDRRGVDLWDGKRLAVVSPDAPHRLLAIDVPFDVPAPPVPRAFGTQATPEPQPARQQVTAYFQIAEPSIAEQTKVRTSTVEIKKMLKKAPGELDPQTRTRIGENGQYGPRVLEALDGLTNPKLGTPVPLKDAVLAVDTALRNRQFAALHQLVTSGRLNNPGDVRPFMGNISDIGKKRQLQEAARRTMDAVVQGQPVPGHVVVLDGKYTPPGATQAYGGDIIDLGDLGAEPNEAIQMKTISGAREQVKSEFKAAVHEQLTGKKGEPPPPGAARVVHLHIERDAADGMGVMDREQLRAALTALGIRELSHVDGKLGVDRIDVTNHAGTAAGGDLVTRVSFTPDDLDGTAGAPGGAPDSGGSSARPVLALPGEPPANGPLADAAAHRTGGIDFSSLQLRYLAEPNSREGLRYAFSARSGTSPEVGLGAAVRASDAFFVWLALRPSTFTVNLNPDEPDRIVDAQLGRTDAGRVLLEADLQLKKSTAALIHPDTPRGLAFWDALRANSGTDSCFTFRQWIVPAPATVHETDDELYILDSPLDVKMETDYLETRSAGSPNGCPHQTPEVEERNENLFRTTVLPEIVKAVNTAPEYAELRRVYLSRVAAQWYRDRSAHQQTTYGDLIDRGDITAWQGAADWTPRKTFDAYVQSFTSGEFKAERADRTFVFGGVDFTTVSLHEVGADAVQAAWPQVTDTFSGPVVAGDGSIWLGSQTAPPWSRELFPASIGWLIASGMVVLFGAGVWTRRRFTRRPR